MRQENLIGQTIAHYRIKKQVGYGGMATVFLAEDAHLGREVAMKVFWPRPGETHNFLRSFAREARVLAQLDHPHILAVYDYGEQDHLAYLVMPYMAGGTLKDLLEERKALPPSEAVPLISQILSALQYAHERNLIHRDIKPGNMLFKADGTLLLGDFGLVKVFAPDGNGKSPLDTIATASETGPMIIGTPEYMAPEQAEGQPSPASDIYAVGVVLYEMLTGVRPFTGHNVLSILMKHVHEEPRAPRDINPYISAPLEAVILRALHKDPAQRFAQAADFQAALAQASIGGGAVEGRSAARSNPISNGGLTIPTNWTQMPVQDMPVSAGAAQAQTLPDRYGTIPAPATNTAKPGPITPLPIPISLHNEGPIGVVPPDPQPQWIAPPVQRGSAPRRRNRLPLAFLAVLSVLLITLVTSLFVTPLGHTIFGYNTPPTATTTTRTGTGTPQTGTTPVATLPTTGRGAGNTPSSGGGNTQTIPTTATNCPASGSARAAVMTPLSLGSHPTLVYIVNEGTADAPTWGTVKMYDTVTGNKTEIAKAPGTRIDEAQVSTDGQWVLFAAHVGGQVELRLVRMDGKGLQTLLCAPAGYRIAGSQWSPDQKYVVFDEEPQTGASTLYLLDMQSGTLQTELPPPTTGVSFLPRTWLDNTRVLLTGFVPNTDGSQQNVYVLDTHKGPDQHNTDLQQVLTTSQPCWDFDSSYDGTKLFVTQCSPGAPTGSSAITSQPVSGGAPTPIYSSSTLSFNTVRVIDPHDTYLLAIASNTGLGYSGGDTSQDGLYRLKTDGSAPQRLSSVKANESSNLNLFSQYFWSNVSRDGTLYALQTTDSSSGTYTLSFGALDGTTSKSFASISGLVMEVAGWTTM